MTASRSLALLLKFFLVTLPSLHGRPEMSEAVLRFVESQEQLVMNSASKATELHANRVEHVGHCKCSRHGCTNELSSSECVLDVPIHNSICGEQGDKWSGRFIDYQRSRFLTPPKEDFKNLSPSIKENICVYRQMEEFWRERFEKDNEAAWTFLGTRDGYTRVYPGAASVRGYEDGDPRMNGCRYYDPRIRPWFISASTGPKDVVLVVDKSGSMNDIIDTRRRSKWDLITDTVTSFLDTFTFTDFVNVVTFSDTASPIWTDTGLVRGGEENLRMLKERMGQEAPDGMTNFAAAFTTAFRLLMQNCNDEPRSCSNCQKIIFFLTDGRDTSGSFGESIKPSEISSLIDVLQQELVAETDRRASIFTFSFTEQADDSIPRQIACANDGAWSFIGTQENALHALNSYFLHMASGKRSGTPVWIEPFGTLDERGLTTTVAIPFYARNANDDSDVFLGVAGHYVDFSEFEKLSISKDDAMDLLIDRSENCIVKSETQCKSQIFRNARDERSLCPDPHPVVVPPMSSTALPSIKCYEHEDRYYRRSIEELTWDDAVAKCREDGGELVSVESARELAVVANFASLDGSWIAASGNSTELFSWLDPAIPDITRSSDLWGLGEPRISQSTQHCAAIDTRGVIGNLFAKPCEERLSYVCKYASNSSCESGVARTPDRGFFKIPPLSKCLDTDESLKAARPVDEARDLRESDIVCDFGEPKSNEEVLCCNPEPVGFAAYGLEEDKGSPSWGMQLDLRHKFLIGMCLTLVLSFLLG